MFTFRESVPDDRSRDVEAAFAEFRGCRQHDQVTASCRAETGTTAEIRRRYADVLETRTCASSDTAEREKCNLELYSLRHRQPV